MQATPRIRSDLTLPMGSIDGVRHTTAEVPMARNKIIAFAKAQITACGGTVVNVSYGDHIKLTLADANGKQDLLVLPCTPSDHRWQKNARAHIRRTLQVQRLPQQPSGDGGAKQKGTTKSRSAKGQAYRPAREVERESMGTGWKDLLANINTRDMAPVRRPELRIALRTPWLGQQQRFTTPHQ
jgi:hypothetical protein